MTLGALRVRLGAAILAAFILNAAYGSALQIKDARPNLGLTALLISCLFIGANSSAILGFGLGLLEASYTSMYVGSYIVTRSLAGWLVGLLEERIFRDNLFIAVLIVFLGTLFVHGCFFLFAPQPRVAQWFLRTLYEAAYNTALAIPAYFLIRRLARPKQKL
jgi:rod shape-determining protein MreD